MTASVERLTHRELDVAVLVRDGLTDREIATRLFISRRTAEWHIEQILSKLGLRSRAQIAAWIAEGHAQSHAAPAPQSRNNLPVQLTSFVGRVAELNRVRELLERSRLVTLVGPGGVGKTRLALEVAAPYKADYRDGVWFVDLAPITDPKLVPQAIASATGIRERRDQPILETVLDVISGWQALMAVDNCEHVLETCADVCGQLLARCPRVRLLATSREALRAPGEVVWVVPALELPTMSAYASAQRLTSSEAVSLFVQRAQDADPAFGLSTSNQALVGALCRRLDGLPLAIELAAARLTVMSLEAIHEHLDRRFDILTRGLRTATPRQQTLLATVEWSYSLLSAEEQIMFDRLAVFNGSFSAESAAAVCNGEGPSTTQILPLLLRLAERSMVSLVQSATGPNRYRLLETLRQFGLQHLDASGQRNALSRRHALYFSVLSEEALAGGRSAERGQWIVRLDVEIDNLRAAFDWALAHEPAMALEITTNLEFYWRSRRFMTEANDRMIAALTNSPNPSLARADALLSASYLAWVTRQGNSACRRLVEEALAIARDLAPPNDLGPRLAAAGATFVDMGDLESGRPLLREAIDQIAPASDRLPDRFGLVLALQYLSWIDYLLGDLESAARVSNQALELIDGGEAMPDRQGWILDTLGFVALAKRDLNAARGYWREMMNIGVRIQELGKIELALIGLSHVAAAEERPERALRLMGAADALQRQWTTVPMPAPTPQVEQLQKHAWASLEPDIAQRVWNEGAQMATDEAIALGLADLD